MIAIALLIAGHLEPLRPVKIDLVSTAPSAESLDGKVLISNSLYQEASPVFREFLVQHETAHALYGHKASVAATDRKIEETSADLYATNALLDLGWGESLKSIRSHLDRLPGGEFYQNSDERWWFINKRIEDLKTVARLEREPGKSPGIEANLKPAFGKTWFPPVMTGVVDVRNRGNELLKIALLVETGIVVDGKWRTFDYRVFRVPVPAGQVVHRPVSLRWFAAKGCPHQARALVVSLDALRDATLAPWHFK